MFKSLGLSFRAFLSNPLKFLSDPANAVMEQRVTEAAGQGKTPAEIETELEAAGMLKGKGAAWVIVDTVGKTAQFLIDNLPKILLAAVVLLLAWYILKLSKVVKVTT